MSAGIMGWRPRRLHALDYTDPIIAVYDKEDSIGTKSMRTQINDILAEDSWSMIGIFRIIRGNMGNDEGRATLIINVYHGSTTIERAEEIARECAIVLERCLCFLPFRYLLFLCPFSLVSSNPTPHTNANY
jgi:hypothetical protein